jgi:hypothetical protein
VKGRRERKRNEEEEVDVTFREGSSKFRNIRTGISVGKYEHLMINQLNKTSIVCRLTCWFLALTLKMEDIYFCETPVCLDTLWRYNLWELQMQ